LFLKNNQQQQSHQQQQNNIRRRFFLMMEIINRPPPPPTPPTQQQQQQQQQQQHQQPAAAAAVAAMLALVDEAAAALDGLRANLQGGEVAVREGLLGDLAEAVERLRQGHYAAQLDLGNLAAQEDGRYPCPIPGCGKSYVKNGGWLRRHLSVIHGVKVFFFIS
jgi:hypothetical protein